MAQSLNGKVEELDTRVERLNNLMWVGLIVLFIGFSAMFGTVATLVIAHFDNSQETFQDLKDEVHDLKVEQKHD